MGNVESSTILGKLTDLTLEDVTQEHISEASEHWSDICGELREYVTTEGVQEEDDEGNIALHHLARGPLILNLEFVNEVLLVTPPGLAGKRNKIDLPLRALFEQIHPHVLKKTHRPSSYHCDLGPRGSRRDCGCKTPEGQAHSEYSWYCSQCDFDCCLHCATHLLGIGLERLNSGEDKLPLHYACGNPYATTEGFNMILQACPHAVTERDSSGKLPLHIAMELGASSEVISALLSASPIAARERDAAGRLPIHYGSGNSRMTATGMIHVLEVYPEAVKEKDGEGRLPLFLAISSGHTPQECIELLIQRYPEAVTEGDDCGKNPVHYSLNNSKVSSLFIDSLLEAHPEAAAEKDTQGNLPLHIGLEHGVSFDVVYTLLRAYPDAATERNAEGVLPLHIALRSQASLEVVNDLLSKAPESAKEKDSNGLLPLNYALNIERNVEQVKQSPHPYLSNMDAVDQYSFPKAMSIKVSFDPRCKTEKKHDFLVFRSPQGEEISPRFMGDASNWPGATKDGPAFFEFPPGTTQFSSLFHSDGSNEDWGYKMTMSVIQNKYEDRSADFDPHNGSDGDEISQLIDALITAYPAALLYRDPAGDLPLHAVLRSHFTFEMVKSILSPYSQAAFEVDGLGRLPLHIAIEQHVAGDDESCTSEGDSDDQSEGLSVKDEEELSSYYGSDETTPVSSPSSSRSNSINGDIVNSRPSRRASFNPLLKLPGVRQHAQHFSSIFDVESCGTSSAESLHPHRNLNYYNTLLLILKAHPEAVNIRYDDIKHPLLVTICNDFPSDVVVSFLEACPEAASATAREGTALHIGLKHGVSVEVISALLSKCPSAATERDAVGMLPLHVLTKKLSEWRFQGLTLQTWDQVISNQLLKFSDESTVCTRPGNVSSYPAALVEVGGPSVSFTCTLTECPPVSNAISFGIALEGFRNSGSNGFGKDGSSWGIIESRGSGSGLGEVCSKGSVVAAFRKLQAGDVLCLRYERSLGKAWLFIDGESRDFSAPELAQEFELHEPNEVVSLVFGATFANDHSLRVERTQPALRLVDSDGSRDVGEMAADITSPEFVEELSVILAAHEMAAKEKDNSGNLSLHYALHCFHATDAILLLLKAHPEAAAEKDAQGNLPLHIGLEHGVSVEVVRALLAAYPGAAMERDVTSEKLPLQLSMVKRLPEEIINELLAANLAAAKEECDTGKYCLHVALANGLSTDTIKAILAAHPDATMQRDGAGNLPLHTALSNEIADEAITVLLSTNPDAAKEKDGSNLLPFQIALSKRLPDGTLFELLKGYPEAAQEKDEEGRLPLHICLLPKTSTRMLVKQGRHPYSSNMDAVDQYSFPKAMSIKVSFDPRCKTEKKHDFLVFRSPQGEEISPRFTGDASNWPGATKDGPAFFEFPPGTTQFSSLFHSDGSNEDWGYKMTISITECRYATEASQTTSTLALDLLSRYEDAASQKDKLGSLPLHYAIENEGLTTECIARLLEAYPAAAMEHDKSGRSPFHVLLSSTKISLEFMKMFLKFNPDVAKERDAKKNLPLHHVLIKNESMEINKEMLDAFPGAAAEKGEEGRLPLHICLLSRNSSKTIVKQSPHPYSSNMDAVDQYSFPKAMSIKVSFDPRCKTEKKHDFLVFRSPQGEEISPRFTGDASNWPGATKDGPAFFEFPPGTTQFSSLFHSDGSNEDWGYKMTMSVIYRRSDDKNSTQNLTSTFAADLLSHYPDASKCRDDVNKLPLHYAVENEDCTMELIQALLTDHPDGAKEFDAEHNLPLHYAVQSRSRICTMVVEALLKENSGGALEKNSKGRLPLHCALKLDTLNGDIVQTLLDANPAAAKEKDKKGRLALHLIVKKDSVSWIEAADDVKCAGGDNSSFGKEYSWHCKECDFNLCICCATECVGAALPTVFHSAQHPHQLHFTHSSNCAYDSGSYLCSGRDESLSPGESNSLASTNMRMRAVCPGVKLRIRSAPSADSSDDNVVGHVDSGTVLEVLKEPHEGFYVLADSSGYVVINAPKLTWSEVRWPFGCKCGAQKTSFDSKWTWQCGRCNFDLCAHCISNEIASQQRLVLEPPGTPAGDLAPSKLRLTVQVMEAGDGIGGRVRQQASVDSSVITEIPIGEIVDVDVASAVILPDRRDMVVRVQLYDLSGWMTWKARDAPRDNGKSGKLGLFLKIVPNEGPTPMRISHPMPDCLTGLNVRVLCDLDSPVVRTYQPDTVIEVLASCTTIVQLKDGTDALRVLLYDGSGWTSIRHGESVYLETLDDESSPAWLSDSIMTNVHEHALIKTMQNETWKCAGRGVKVFDSAGQRIPARPKLSFESSPERAIITALMDVFPDAASKKDEEELTPLHLASMNVHAAVEYTDILLSKCPASARSKDKNNKLAFDYFLGQGSKENKGRVKKNPHTTVSFLLADLPFMLPTDAEIKCALPLSVQTHYHSWNKFVDYAVRDPALSKEIITLVIESFDIRCRSLAVRALAHAKDELGREAISIASREQRLLLNKYLYFCGRYELQEGPPVHRSATAIVVYALDHEEDLKNVEIDPYPSSLKLGDWVRRGPHWSYKDQDCHEGIYHRGVVVNCSDTSYEISWRTNPNDPDTSFHTNTYNFKEDKYDVFRIAVEAETTAAEDVSSEKLVALDSAATGEGLDRSEPTPVTYNATESAVMEAVTGQDVEALRLLIQQHSSQVSMFECHDSEGRTPLMLASLCSATDVVAMLLTVPGISINLRDNYGTSALMFAAHGPHTPQSIVTLRALLATPGIELDALIDRRPNPALIFPAGEAGGVSKAIGDAIDYGAPAYNEGNKQGCADRYILTAVQILSAPAVQGFPRTSLSAAITAATGYSSQQTIDQQAWTMRRSFDATLKFIRQPQEAPSVTPASKKSPAVARKVVVKFMRNYDQWQRERKVRLEGSLDPNYVVGILDGPPDAEFEEQTKHLVHDGKPLAEYRYGIIMPAADRSLDGIYRSERPDLLQIEKIMYELALALKHCHDNKVTHGDLKLLNALRVDGKIRLIDLDASARIGQDFMGVKFSSGNLAPELFYTLKAGEEKIYKKYWGNIVKADISKDAERADAELWQKIKPVMVRKGFESWSYVVKTFRVKEDSIDPIKEGLPYEDELVRASATADIWAFGLILFNLVSGSALLPTNLNDDLADGNAVKTAASWRDEDIQLRVGRITQEREHSEVVQDLLLNILKVLPEDRYSLDQIMRHAFFKHQFVPDADLADKEKEMEKHMHEIYDLPLHIALEDRRSEKEICDIIAADKDKSDELKAVRKKDKDGQLALHYAAGMSATDKVVDALLIAYEEGARVRDIYGHLALKYALNVEVPNSFVLFELVRRDLPIDEEGKVKEPHLHAFSWTSFIDETKNRPELAGDVVEDVFKLFSGTQKHCIAALAHAKDENGREAISIAHPDVQQIMYQYLYFCGRYEIQSGAPIHRSATAVVMYALDHAVTKYYDKVFEAMCDHEDKLDFVGFREAISSLLEQGLLSELAESETISEESFCTVLAKSSAPTTAAIGAVSSIPAAAAATLDCEQKLTKAQFIDFCVKKIGGVCKVAIKFMRNADQHDREKKNRTTTSEKPLSHRYVVGLLDGPDDLAFKEAVETLHYSNDDGQGEISLMAFRYGLILPAADRSLQQIFQSERPDLLTIKRMMREVLIALQHCHENDIIHCDLKPLNVLRVNGTMRLIDLDASCPRNGHMGSKFSSGILAPEMFHTLSGSEEQSFQNYWRDYYKSANTDNRRKEASDRQGGEAAQILREKADWWRKIEPVEPQLGGKIVVKTFLQSNKGKGLPYVTSLVPATPAADIWSFGVMLFFLVSGKPLLSVNRDDDLDDPSSFYQAANWTDTQLRSKITDLPMFGENQNYARAVKALLKMVLRRKPEDRLSIDEILGHPFFTDNITARLTGDAVAEWDVFISYRVDTDQKLAEMLYDKVHALGCRVYLDKHCLKDGKDWEEGFVAGLVRSRCFVPLLSKGGIKRFEALQENSKCDNVLLEHRLAIELKQRGFVENIFPVFIGERDSDDIYADFFECGASPSPSSAVVRVVEEKLMGHLDREGLGAPILDQPSVKDVYVRLLKNQGDFVRSRDAAGNSRGNLDAILSSIAGKIAKMVEGSASGDSPENVARLRSELEEKNRQLAEKDQIIASLSRRSGRPSDVRGLSQVLSQGQDVDDDEEDDEDEDEDEGGAGTAGGVPGTKRRKKKTRQKTATAAGAGKSNRRKSSVQGPQVFSDTNYLSTLVGTAGRRQSRKDK